jgi:hypothetical protein
LRRRRVRRDTGRDYDGDRGRAREFFARANSHDNNPAMFWHSEPHVAEQVFHEMLREAGVKLVTGQKLRNVTFEVGATRQSAGEQRGRAGGSSLPDGNARQRVHAWYANESSGARPFGQVVVGRDRQTVAGAGDGRQAAATLGWRVVALPEDWRSTSASR